MKKWSYLKPGDIVDVIAPSSWCDKGELERGAEYLASIGLDVRTPKNLFKPDFVYANNIETTLDHMRHAFYAKDSKAIWCARGGAGSFRFLHYLKKWRVPQKTKMFVGISDITSLHTFLNQVWGWSTLHGPMINMMSPRRSTKRERRDMENIIFGKKDFTEFKGLKSLNVAAQKKKLIKGRVLGGNLALLQSSIGTPWQPNFNGKILFMEDIDERGYEVERMLSHMINARFFKGVRAITFGDFVGGVEKDGTDLVKVALKRFAQQVKFPVLKGIQSGHGSLVRTVPFNTLSELRTGERANLKVSTGGTHR